MGWFVGGELGASAIKLGTRTAGSRKLGLTLYSHKTRCGVLVRTSLLGQRHRLDPRAVTWHLILPPTPVCHLLPTGMAQPGIFFKKSI